MLMASEALAHRWDRRLAFFYDSRMARNTLTIDLAHRKMPVMIEMDLTIRSVRYSPEDTGHL